MRRRKQFPCGHRGFGRYCHHCAQAGVVGSNSIVLSFELDEEQPQAGPPPDEAAGLSLTHLHPDVARRAAHKLELIERGAGYRALGGKRLQSNGLVSIPIGHRYRILCRGGEGRLEPISVLSHEAYNHVV